MIASSEPVEISESVETPSGKGARDENFPVGSVLLPKRFRPHVAIFYAYARAIDDIADHETLAPATKIHRLQAFASAVTGMPGYGAEFNKAHALKRSLDEMDISSVHATDLVAAFIQDCRKLRYQSWEELLQYCALSANPVGRYLLDLHGEDKKSYQYSDALCTVLQIVNHLQDCKDDKASLDRVYIIEPWLINANGSVDDIDKNQSSAALRAAMNRMLDRCEILMNDAHKLPGALKSRHLAMESAVIIRLADKLISLLREGDPVATRIDLRKIHFASAAIRGAFFGFFSVGKST